MLAAVVVTALLAGAATATAQSLITSADIANNTIRGKDVRQRTLTLRDLKRSTSPRCAGSGCRQGREGREGSKGREARRAAPEPPALRDLGA